MIPQLRELSTLLGAFAAKLNSTTLGASPAEASVAPAPFISNIAVHVSSGVRADLNTFSESHCIHVISFSLEQAGFRECPSIGGSADA